MNTDHHHSHAHSHHSAPETVNVWLWPLLLISIFAIIEALGGWFTGSLALLGDAGHMVSDAAALGLAWLGSWIARKPASQQHSFGLMRAEVIVALVNGLLMLLVVTFIIIEAIERLQTPRPVLGGEVMLIALLGLAVNVIVAFKLHGDQDSMNKRAALLHVMGDLLGSVAALVAGAVIYFTGWMPIDPILSLFISALILVSTIRLLREVLHVLMEGVPAHLDIGEVAQTLSAVPQVRGIHSVHIWALSSQMTALSAHVVLDDMQVWREVLTDLRQVLHERFAIDHVTLQPETGDDVGQDAADCWLAGS